MNGYLILLLVAALSSIGLVSANSICDNAPCEKPINASLEKEFSITIGSNPGSTGFDWWTSFDTQYLSLANSTFVPGNAPSGMEGVPGKKIFTFNAKRAGNTEVIMLLLQPWVNGTIAEEKIFPVSIKATAK